jgi:hypothetical protein
LWIMRVVGGRGVVGIMDRIRVGMINLGMGRWLSGWRECWRLYGGGHFPCLSCLTDPVFDGTQSLRLPLIVMKCFIYQSVPEFVEHWNLNLSQILTISLLQYHGFYLIIYFNKCCIIVSFIFILFLFYFISPPYPNWWTLEASYFESIHRFLHPLVIHKFGRDLWGLAGSDMLSWPWMKAQKRRISPYRGQASQNYKIAQGQVTEFQTYGLKKIWGLFTLGFVITLSNVSSH